MNQWQLWLQLALGAIGTVNPEIGALVQMIGNGVLTIQGVTDEDKALLDGWRVYCQRMIDGSVSVEDARVVARAFADATHANNQSLAAGGPPVPIPSPPAA
jgi:hypothetical protein